MVKLVSITIPDSLKSVWERIPNKSAFVTKHLRELGGWTSDDEHTSWSSGLNMCNMYHKDGVCVTCMEAMNMIEYDIIQEYEMRKACYERGEIYWGEEE